MILVRDEGTYYIGEVMPISPIDDGRVPSLEVKINGKIHTVIISNVKPISKDEKDDIIYMTAEINELEEQLIEYCEGIFKDEIS